MALVPSWPRTDLQSQPKLRGAANKRHFPSLEKPRKPIPPAIGLFLPVTTCIVNLETPRRVPVPFSGVSKLGRQSTSNLDVSRKHYVSELGSLRLRVLF